MITALLLAAIQSAAPAPPATPMPGAGDRTAVREIVVIREDDGPAAKGQPDRQIRIVDLQPSKDGDRREIRILREPGAPGARIAMISCEDESKVDSEATGKDGKKTRVMVCAKGGNRVEALESASKRIAENKHLSEDVKARVLGQMNAEIARLKAAN